MQQRNMQYKQNQPPRCRSIGAVFSRIFFREAVLPFPPGPLGTFLGGFFQINMNSFPVQILLGGLDPLSTVKIGSARRTSSISVYTFQSCFVTVCTLLFHSVMLLSPLAADPADGDHGTMIYYFAAEGHFPANHARFRSPCRAIFIRFKLHRADDNLFHLCYN